MSANVLLRPDVEDAGYEGTRIRLLGGFELDGAGLLPPSGTAAILLRIVAVHGRLQIDEVIELLWPDAPPDAGRNRLRNVLMRLRRAVGDLVVRGGNELRLADGVEVDVMAFAVAAERALALPLDDPQAGALAKAALALYRGELSPWDRYQDWAAAPRERMRRLAVDLHDLLARQAVDRGHVRDALATLERAAALEPLDEDRLLWAARLAHEHGYRGRALALLDHAARIAAELGLPSSPAHAALLQRMRARGPGQK